MFFGETARAKKTKIEQNCVIYMMISPVISVLPMKMPLTMCLTNIYRLCYFKIIFLWGLEKYGHFKTNFAPKMAKHAIFDQP